MPHPRRHPTGPTGPAGPTGRDRGRGHGRVRRTHGPSRPGAGVTRPGGPHRTSPHATTTGGSAAGRRTTGSADAPTRRPRLTGRAAVLVLVLVVLATSYASSLRAYLDQRAQLDDLASTISTREGEIDGLESERERWQDPAYVRIQARERLGYVRPGETSYVATRDGVPIEGGDSLDEDDAATEPPDPPWYDDMWDSARIAGDPPRTTTPPAERINGRSAAE